MKKILIIFLGCMVVVFMFLVTRAGKQKPPNIIFITVDALRADHLGCYGYQRNTSPNIDKLAREGAMFNKCFATSSATVCSFPSILTGIYLAINKKDYVLYENNLDNKFDTLAEDLKKAGYYTAAFVKNPHLRIKNGFGQGIDYFRNIMEEEGEAQAITARVLDFLNNYQDNKPLFIWVHYLDPHAPYTASREYFKKFENDELYKENDRMLELRPMDLNDPNEKNPGWASDGYIPDRVFRTGRHNLNYYIASYDAEILQADFYIGKLLESVKDDTIIILTSDHGESLGEHDQYFSRGANIYDELLHVPLIIKDSLYFKGGKKISTVVSSVDIVPTILSRINSLWYFFNKNKFNGIDLIDMLNGKNTGRRYIYSFSPYACSIRDVRGNIKYILQKKGGELYFLPDENTNYVKDNSPQVVKIRKELKIELRKWIERGLIASDVNSKKASLDRETKELLKALGYLK
jgi:arylsulfatase A-like enzyme